MKFKVKWTVEAEEDLNHIIDYYFEKAGIRVAEDIYSRIKTQVASLKNFPHRCRPGLVAGTKEYIVSRLPYRVVVEITGEVGLIFSIAYHTLIIKRATSGT